MKKLFIVLAVLISAIISNKEEKIIIPDSSIRLRVVASSSNLEDQVVKNKVSKSLIEYLTNLTKGITEKQDVENTILINMKNINSVISNYTDDYKVSFGRNEFPKKEYKGVTYPAGYYESLVVNIGASNGINWWCCIYPPLCNIDNENKNDIEYTTLVKELLSNYNK